MTYRSESECATHYTTAPHDKIESVQRWCTKRIKWLSNLTYCERLIKLGNDRLELRRLRAHNAHLVKCYKILHHSVDLHQVSIFFTMSSIIKTRGNSYKLIVPFSRINARANYFSVRIISLMYGIGFQTKWWMPLAFHLLITNLLTPIWNLD